MTRELTQRLPVSDPGECNGPGLTEVDLTIILSFKQIHYRLQCRQFPDPPQSLKSQQTDPRLLILQKRCQIISSRPVPGVTQCPGRTGSDHGIAISQQWQEHSGHLCLCSRDLTQSPDAVDPGELICILSTRDSGQQVDITTVCQFKLRLQPYPPVSVPQQLCQPMSVQLLKRSPQ